MFLRLQATGVLPGLALNNCSALLRSNQSINQCKQKQHPSNGTHTMTSWHPALSRAFVQVLEAELRGQGDERQLKQLAPALTSTQRQQQLVAAQKHQQIACNLVQQCHHLCPGLDLPGPSWDGHQSFADQAHDSSSNFVPAVQGEACR